MTEMIGEVSCNYQNCRWEVWSNGRAYANTSFEPFACYRRENGVWKTTITTKNGIEVAASKAIEELYQLWLNGVFPKPVDPTRHLRKK